MNGALTAACLVLLASTEGAAAQRIAAPLIPLDAGAEVSPPGVHPRLGVLPDAPMLAGAIGMLVTSRALAITRPVVPPEGLDPGTIAWSMDRSVVGHVSTQADIDSDDFRDAALAYPVILAFLTESSENRWNGALERNAVFGESVLLAEGISSVIKNLSDRPRPFTYLPVAVRPTTGPYDVKTDEAFRSMPSGHAVMAFSATAFAATDNLITRPNAGWSERLAVSSLGGFLAGMTGTLRVKGGQHFPTDVIVGGLIGTASGVTVPLAHLYLPSDHRRIARLSGDAWLTALAGYVGGVGAGVATAALTY